MTLSTFDRYKTIKVILWFAGIGALGGLCFALLVTRTANRSWWFTKREWWTFPTWKYWLATVACLIITLTVAYVVSLTQGWLTPAKSRWPSKLLAFLSLSATFPLLTWLVEYGPAYGFIFVPIILASLVSLALLALTRMWDRRVATLILIACLLRTPLASIPGLLLSRSMPGIWFDAFRFVIVLSLISGLAGYWLVRSDFKETLRS